MEIGDLELVPPHLWYTVTRPGVGKDMVKIGVEIETVQSVPVYTWKSQEVVKAAPG